MELRDAIYGRRSIRKYLDKPIAQQDIEDIMELACQAPSGTNLQQWYFIVVQTKENLEKLGKILDKAHRKALPFMEKRFANNPEVITETGDFLRTIGHAPCCILAFLYKNDYEDELTAIESVSAAMENICLAAYDKGLGTCWMTAPVDVEEDIQEAFGDGKGRLVGGITLGYAEIVPKAPKRKDGRVKYI